MLKWLESGILFEPSNTGGREVIKHHAYAKLSARIANFCRQNLPNVSSDGTPKISSHGNEKKFRSGVCDYTETLSVSVREVLKTSVNVCLVHGKDSEILLVPSCSPPRPRTLILSRLLSVPRLAKYLGTSGQARTREHRIPDSQ